MERHGIDDGTAFERIRSQARSERRPIMSVVQELLG
jgi:AmiR/NasT family two-component response regulator